VHVVVKIPDIQSREYNVLFSLCCSSPPPLMCCVDLDEKLGKLPWLTLVCYFPAETPSFVPIRKNPDVFVLELSKAIYEELKSQGHDVRLEDLSLYKVFLLALLQASN
jgi:hypothetical protein